jgi:N-acetylmuramoyl-L-alanine amidase
MIYYLYESIGIQIMPIIYYMDFSRYWQPGIFMNRLILSAVLILSTTLVFGEVASPAAPAKEFSPAMKAVMSGESSTEYLQSLASISNTVDDIYSGLYEKLRAGKKIKIFMDPVHGKVKTSSGAMEWQGNLSWRKSTTGAPEEVYSIPLARLIYRKFIDSGHFDVVSTPDYMEVLKGNSDSYNDITFDETVDFAKKAGAFMIIAEHLNNISPINKADGAINLHGVHLTCTEQRKPLLSYVGGIYRGYFTYFNIFDITGTSRAIGEGFRTSMLDLGHEPNGWDNGVVADGTFSIYINFPIATIYESGFISNPDEEKLLKDETYQETIVESQYEGILSAIQRVFGVDLSSSRASKERDEDPLCIELIKLSRVAVYYTQIGEFKKAVAAINTLEKFAANSKYKNNAAQYSNLKSRLLTVDSYRKTGAAYLKKKNYSKAYIAYQNAVRIMGYNGLFNSIRETIYAENNIAARQLGKRSIYYSYPMVGQYDVNPPLMAAYQTQVENHSLYTPYLITIAEGQSLEEAVDLSIAPRDSQREQIVKAMKYSTISKAVYTKVYSKKSKKYVYQKSIVKMKPEFTPGLYIVSFDKQLGLKSVTRTNSVPFDPNRYQNQQYFKNSSLADRKKEKAL